MFRGGVFIGEVAHRERSLRRSLSVDSFKIIKYQAGGERWSQAGRISLQ